MGGGGGGGGGSETKKIHLGKLEKCQSCKGEVWFGHKGPLSLE